MTIPLDERLGYKTTYRLAQRISSHVVLKYVRPVVKKKGISIIKAAAAPANVIEKSIADVSFLVAMILDKFYTTNRCIDSINT